MKLAIDDFGTGYSSLNYVRELPVDILKIDRSFLADTQPQVEQLTAAIVELARIFNLKAVAEGVESPGQLAQLQGMHCDFGQGFHFAEPLTAEEILAMATRPRRRTPGGSRATAPGRPSRRALRHRAGAAGSRGRTRDRADPAPRRARGGGRVAAGRATSPELTTKLD